MRAPTLDHCLHVLGLEGAPGAAEVKAAFRRLARQFHPDVNPSPAASRRFVEVVEAYRLLRERLVYHADDPDWGLCPRCRRYDDLLEAMWGGVACPDCLLGMTIYRKYLPMPLIVVVRHVAVWVLYGLSVALCVQFARTHAPGWAAAAGATSLSGLLLLACQVVWLARRAPY